MSSSSDVSGPSYSKASMVHANTDRLSARSDRNGKPPDTSSAHSCHTGQTISLLHTPVTPNKPSLLCTLLSPQANHYSSAHSCHTKQTFTPLHTPLTPNKPLLLCTLLSHQTNHHSSAHSCHTQQTITPLHTPLTPSQSSKRQALRHFSRTLLPHQANHLVGIRPPGTQFERTSRPRGTEGC